jgi:hypothetical protein
MVEGHEDVTYRRQKAALGSLVKTTNSNSSTSAASSLPICESFSPDELRLRKILLSVQDGIDADKTPETEGVKVRRRAQEFAATTVSWMQSASCYSNSRSALDEAVSALEAHPGLNSSQLALLKEAMGRTVTLLQVTKACRSTLLCLIATTTVSAIFGSSPKRHIGFDPATDQSAPFFIYEQGPPGTGKSRCLAAGITSMCRVFCDNRGRSRDLAAMGFELPTLTPVEEWNNKTVCKWLNTWKERETGDQSSPEYSENIAVTEEAKEIAFVTFKARYHSNSRRS